MSAEKSGKCWYCHSELEPADYGRQETCPKCRRDTRVCKNCIHYDTHYNNHCKENQADRIVEKERSNFCDYFHVNDQISGTSQFKSDPKAAAEALFKKKS